MDVILVNVRVIDKAENQFVWKNAKRVPVKPSDYHVWVIANSIHTIYQNNEKNGLHKIAWVGGIGYITTAQLAELRKIVDEI